MPIWRLNLGDPRAGERTWQLMAQVAGRAGRGEKPGRALIQTYLPDHPLMQSLKRGDRDGFLAQEKRIRQESGLAALWPARRHHHFRQRCGRNRALRAALSQGPHRGEGVTMLGPAPAPIHLVRGRFRWRFLVKARREVNVQAFLRDWLKDIKPKGSIHLGIDVDPYNFL